MWPSLRALLGGLIDSAGLFPPAALAMPEAVRRYAAYRAGPHGWMLGRLVVPAARLEELERALAGVVENAPRVEPWQISVLAAPPFDAVVARIWDFNGRH